MGQLKISCGAAATLLLVCAASPASAQAARTWVSNWINPYTLAEPSDSNPCSRTAPCKTFAGAIAKTAIGGEISVLDPGSYGPVTIDKSITINGTSGAGYGSIVHASAGTSAIVINMPSNDPYKSVRLNWLDINGVSTAEHGIRILDNQTVDVSVVIENTNIDGLAGSGISDERSAGGKLTVSNTVVRHTQKSGIKIAAGGKTKIQATLSNVRVHNAAQAGLTVNGGAKATVRNSVFSGSAFGIDVEQANSEVSVDGSTISHNATGFFTTGGAVLRLSNSSVAFNDSVASGTVQSFTNNRFIANGAGSPVAPIGQPSSPTGQQ